jgi:hypothetical protein
MLPRTVATLLLLLASCSTQIPSSDDPNGSGGAGDDEFGVGPDATPAPSCAEVRPIEVQEALPPDLLLVVDKSGSMDDNVGGAQKWGTMRSALGTTLSENSNTVNFGLMLYPTNDTCAAGSISTPVSGNSGASINAALGSVSPDGGTPTHTSLQNALSYFQSTAVNPNGRFVLLATDGEPNCKDPNDPTIPTVNESVAAITALKSAGIPTYVLGFGGGVNGTTLQAMAQAGGQSQYYSASSPTELAAALDAITGDVALPDCSFSLGEVPSDPSRLRLYFDNQEVGRSNLHTDGWDYDTANNTLTIYGASCDQLQGGAVGEVRVDYGCEGATID